jgi:hypothetical protein
MTHQEIFFLLFNKFRWYLDKNKNQLIKKIGF